jgi:hypothetical protein
MKTQDLIVYAASMEKREREKAEENRKGWIDHGTDRAFSVCFCLFL